jgi:hypothetical protein
MTQTGVVAIAARRAVLVLAACAAAAAPRPLPAQEAPPTRGTPPVIKWGKWMAAAAAVSFTAMGVERHRAGDAAFRDLVRYCQQTLCTLTPDGRYADPGAEGRYQHVVRADRAARAWLIGGQIAAIGTAVLFVLELRRSTEPPNIPYSGLVIRSGAHGMQVGWGIAF